MCLNSWKTIRLLEESLVQVVSEKTNEKNIQKPQQKVRAEFFVYHTKFLRVHLGEVSNFSGKS